MTERPARVGPGAAAARGPAPGSVGRKLAAVVVPLSNRATLTPDEEISLRHLRHYLAAYDTYVVVPASLRIALPGCRVKRFDDRFFGTVAANRRLMLSRRFYEAFADYRFILLYHLDALVFSGDLDAWCALDYDYIGSPWPISSTDPERGFSRVGNGGFSLRKIESFLRVMDSKRLAVDPEVDWRRRYGSRNVLDRLIHLPRRYLKRLRVFNNVRRELKAVSYNEDFFWSDRAIHFDPAFRVAPVKVGLRFSFETAPRLCFERNGRRLPFGCHAWTREDRAFWEPFLLR